MSELDDISSPPIAAAATPVASPLDDFSRPVGSTAQQKAVVSTNASPDDAGKALSLSKQTGIPPSIVQTDLPGYGAHAKQQEAIKAVQNPAIAKYIDGNPMAAQASNDDYLTLNRISGFFSGLQKQALDHAATLDIVGQIPSLSSLQSSEPGREKIRGYMERMRSGFIGGFGDTSEVSRILTEAKDLGLTQQTIDFWEGSGLLPAARAIEGGIRLVPGLVGGAVGLASGLVAEGTRSEAWGDRLLREGPAANAALMGTGASAPLRLPKFAPVDLLHNFLAEHTPGGPRAQALSASETPVDQMWQAKPLVDQAKAESAGAALDGAIDAAKESKTAERSPELFEEYIEAHGATGTVAIPAQAILDIYKREGKVPIHGDGLFGDIPGIADKATLAAETGADVKIPIKKYITIAKDNDQLHATLKDQLRVNEAPSREEAKAAVEDQKAKIEAYHGTPHDFEQFDLTKIGTGEGAQSYGHGLYFAENQGTALEYKNRLGGTDSINSLPISIKAKNTLANYTFGDKPISISEIRSRMEADLRGEGELGHIPGPTLIAHYNQVLAEIKNLTGKVSRGQLYKVSIAADPTHFLDWDKPFSEQSPEVQAVMQKMLVDKPWMVGRTLEKIKGEEFYQNLGQELAGSTTIGDSDFIPGKEGRPLASKALAEAGIPGIKYLDQGSRGVGDGTRNFVVFDDRLVKITEKNGNPIVQAAVEKTVKEKQSLYLQPLFKDAKTLNITESEFKKYSDQIDRAEEQVLARAVELAKRETARRLTPEWRLNEDRTRGEVEKELNKDPAIMADRYFNTDKRLLPSGQRIIHDAWKPLGEVKSDEWAPIFGFESGSDMVMAILGLEQERADLGIGPKAQMKRRVDAETAARMEAKYGNLADNIALEASETALSNWNANLLATEWKMLAGLNGVKPPLGRDELTSWARDQFDKSTASDVSYETWRRAAEKSGREAEKAFLSKDVKEAFIQKQRQMLNFLLAREAKDFEKEVTRNEKLMDKYAVDVNLPAVEQAYTDQIHRLLQQYGVETRRTVENTDYNLQGKPFDDFVASQNQNGAMIVKADLPMPRPGQNVRPMDTWTVDQYRDFATMLKSLDHNGRAVKQIELAGKKEAFNEVIDKVAKNLDTLEKNDFDPDAKGLVSGLRTLGRAIDSRLLKAEKLMDWIDKKDPLGAMNSAVLRGLIEGEQVKGDMITKLAKMAKELPGDRAWGKALNDATTNKELLNWETGKPMQLSNENKIVIALNYGNKSNRRVMLEAMHWTEAEVETYLARELTPMDKAMVDGIHGLFEPLAPLVEKATSSRAGVAVPLIEGSPVLGMKGGYYPLISDPRAKLLGQQTETDLFQKTKFDPLPTAPALKQRTGKVYPVDLSLDNIHNILSRTAHAVFMQDPVINANKVISDPVVREGIANAFGPEYVQMLDKWIRDIADNGGSDVGFQDDKAAWLSRNLRQNVTVQLMGWKASTALIHGGSAGASSVYESFKLHMPEENAGKALVLAPVRLVQNIKDLGLGQFLPQSAQRFFGSQTNMFDTMNFVYENSGEMRNRQRSLQKDFGFQLNKITNSGVIDDLAILRNMHQTYSMSMVAYLDQLTATPVWKATYDKALVDGVEHSDAVYIADKAVREAHGSASLVSRANIGRGEINKWLTIAYNGYWNHNYNKMREAGKEVTFGSEEGLTAGQRVAIGAGFMTAMIVAPALIHHAVRGEESETWGGAVSGMMASQFGGTVPIVNTLTYSMIHNKDPSISPLEEVLKSASNLYRDQVAKNPKHTTLHAAQALGYFTGLPPTNQAIAAFSFMNDVLQDRQDPDGVQEWARGIMTGKSQPKAHR